LLVIYVACVSEQEAELISKGLVENRLAACVNVADVRSVFRWQGKIENEKEKLLIIKSVESRLPELERYVKANHSYNCPELIALKAEFVSKEYADWVRSACEPE